MIADYDEIADKYDAFFSQKKYTDEDFELSKKLPKIRGRLLDIGCGTGLLFDLYKMCNVNIPDYTGVDPSFNMLKHLILRHGNNRCFCSTFEEFESDEKFDTIISCYGSPSYIKPKGILKIKEVANNGASVFLMFYKDGYYPVTHTFSTKKIILNKFSSYKKYISKLSSNLNYEEWNNYVIVSGVL